MTKKLAALLFGLALVCAITLPTRADIPVVTRSASFTGSGTQNGPITTLGGHNICVVKTSGGATGYTVTVKGSASGGTLSTLTQFGSSGAITSDGSYAATLTGTVVATTQFTYVVTGTITGTLTVVTSCTGAGASVFPPGTVTVAVSNFPSPGPTSSPGNVPLSVPANASASPYGSVTNPGATSLPSPGPAMQVVSFCHGYNAGSWYPCKIGTGGMLYTFPVDLNGNGAVLTTGATGNSAAQNAFESHAVCTGYNGIVGSGLDFCFMDKSSAGTGSLVVTSGGRFKTILTSASATTCTSLETETAGNVGRLVSLTNTGPALTVFLQIYDEAGSPTCATGDDIWGDGSTIVIGAGQTITLNIPVTSGLAYKLSGALTAGQNVIVARN